MIGDFANVIDREKAALGLFITLAEPTRTMKKEAAVKNTNRYLDVGNKLKWKYLLTNS